MTEVIIAILFNLMIGSSTETVSTQDQEAPTTETVDSMGGSGTWVTIEK
jgi:hypothetical protein